MGILDSFASILGASGPSQTASSAPTAIAVLLTTVLQNAGGFDGVLAKLNDAGLGAKVNSWLGNGDNMPITPAEIRSALGNEHLKQLATKLGVPMDQVAAIVAQHLPAAVDKASPNGIIKPS